MIYHVNANTRFSFATPLISKYLAGSVLFWFLLRISGVKVFAFVCSQVTAYLKPLGPKWLMFNRGFSSLYFICFYKQQQRKSHNCLFANPILMSYLANYFCNASNKTAFPGTVIESK